MLHGGYAHDRLENYTKQWAHSVWGFIIYRTSYGRNTEFASYIDFIKEDVEDSFEDCGALEQPVYQELVWTVIEDQDKLHNASKDAVRLLFDEWCKSDAPSAEQPNSSGPPGKSTVTRYNYCIVIDDAALDSWLAEGSRRARGEDKPFVNVIARHHDTEFDDEDEDEDDEDEEEEDDDLSSVEGSTDEDVGWMKCSAEILHPGLYENLCDPNAWYIYYVRPPQIMWK